MGIEVVVYVVEVFDRNDFFEKVFFFIVFDYVEFVYAYIIVGW